MVGFADNGFMPKAYTLSIIVVALSVSSFFIYPSLGIKTWVKSFSPPTPERLIKNQSAVDQLIIKNPVSEKNVPEFDKDNPQSNGIFLIFKHYPLSEKQKSLILQITNKEQLKLENQFVRLKAWAFLWDKWYPAIKAKRVCEKFKSISFVEHCQINQVLEPALEDNPKNIGIAPKPNVGKFKPLKTNIRNCGIVSANHNLKFGSLSDYWAQRAIGADLSKEELLFAPPVKKNLVAVFDTPKEDHDAGVRNIISGSGKQAVMPDLRNSLTTYNINTRYSLTNTSQHLLNTADAKCRSRGVAKLRYNEFFYLFVGNILPQAYAFNTLVDRTADRSQPMIDTSTIEDNPQPPEKGNPHPADSTATDKKFKLKKTHPLIVNQLVAQGVARGEVSQSCKAQEMPSFINYSMVSTDEGRALMDYKNFKSLSPYSVIIAGAGNSHPKRLYLQQHRSSKDFDMIFVGSLASNGEKSSFSTEGEEVHITAPSDYFLTSLDKKGNYKKFGGTSGATALVTGSLATFERLSGYHPTAKEAKALLKNTAISVPSAVPKESNGYGMVNAYKLAMIGKRLKEQCGNDKSCFKQKINDPKNYYFSPSKILSQVRGAFPECDNQCVGIPSQSGCRGASCTSRRTKQCNTKSKVFNELRKAAFLSPHDGDLWRNIACIYQSAGFTEDAQMALSVYKSTNAGSDARVEGNYQKCHFENDCTLVPVKSECYSISFGKSKTKDFRPMNKASAEVYYLGCMQKGNRPPDCNGKCRCRNTEIAINKPKTLTIEPAVIGDPPDTPTTSPPIIEPDTVQKRPLPPTPVSQKQYKVACVNHQCIMSSEQKTIKNPKGLKSPIIEPAILKDPPPIPPAVGGGAVQ